MEYLIENIDWEIDNEALRFKVESILDSITDDLINYHLYANKYADAVVYGKCTEYVNKYKYEMNKYSNIIRGKLFTLEQFIPYEFQFYTISDTVFLQCDLRVIWSYSEKE